ncbi:hypothetical protein B0H16DRAFT_1711715 [Mycena metata]|uniref:Uncharacterized protein n=1 Tax=Mycena metata TaxID=1033252 RepID=A0AAD7NWK4_9AGAR|nr:hypothetical protein B0H16DRAFT_1711715 [Mycena metata]
MINHYLCNICLAPGIVKLVGTSRFQVVVLSAYYKQIRNSQSVDVLSDIDEDNYNCAFSFLRPVIQGASDMGKLLSETELQKKKQKEQ